MLRLKLWHGFCTCFRNLCGWVMSGTCHVIGGTMNKTELIQAVAESTELSKAKAGDAVNAVLEHIKDALAKEEEVSLIGFGNFYVRQRAARTGRNPKTKEPIEIKASKVPAFKPGKSLKSAVNGEASEEEK